MKLDNLEKYMKKTFFIFIFISVIFGIVIHKIVYKINFKELIFQLFLGLLTNILSLYLGFYIIDLYIKKVEEKDLIIPKKLGQENVSYMINSFSTSMRVLLSMEYKYYKVKSSDTKDFVINIFKDMKGIFIKEVPKFDQKDWKDFIKRLNNFYSTIDDILLKEDKYLDLKIISDLKQIQVLIRGISARYSVIPDMLGVPQSKRQKLKDPKLANLYEKRTILYIEKSFSEILDKSIEIKNNLPNSSF